MMLSARHALFVFAGGAVGTGLRWAVDSGVNFLDWNVVVALLIVNVAGSFALGWLVALPTTAMHVHPLFAVGLLGSFTTFSGYTVAVVGEIDAGALSAAVVFAIGSVVIGYLAAQAGRTLGSAR